MPTPEAVHAVAHTARMQMVLAARPDHPRKPEYDEQLAIYREQWASLSVEDRALTAAALIADPDAADMTSVVVAGAVALLEG